MQVHLVDGTYELFRHHFGAARRTSPPTACEVAARGGVLGSLLQMLERRRDPRRRRHRPRHRVVPQRPLAAATRRARASSPSCWRSSRCSRRRCARWASPCGRWSSSRPTTRSAPRPRVAAGRRAGRAGASSARPTRTSASACGAAGSSQLDRRHERTRDEAGVREKFGVAAGVDPRLPGAGRRQRRRLPRPPRLGRQVRGGRARALRAPRGDPDRLRRLGRARPRRRPPGGDARRGARAGRAVPGPRDPAGRRRGRARPRASRRCAGAAPPPACGRCATTSTRPTCSRAPRSSRRVARLTLHRDLAERSRRAQAALRKALGGAGPMAARAGRPTRPQGPGAARPATGGPPCRHADSAGHAAASCPG